MDQAPKDPAEAPKFFQTSEFKSLNDEWKQKLKDSGFADIERDEDSLPDWSTAFARHPEYGRSKEEYYRLAGQFLHEYRFRGPEGQWMKRIWELHANGTSIREIVDILNPGEKHWHTVRKKVQLSLAKLKRKMIEKCQKQLSG